MPSEWAKVQVQRMARAICHGSAFESGTWSDEAEGIYVGWALHKSTFSSELPWQNEKRDVSLFFSGEEFPDPDTPQRLKERGHTLQSGPCSYLVHLYEDDPAFPAGLNGRFQGLLVDRARQRILLFNDRYGMHRICFLQAP